MSKQKKKVVDWRDQLIKKYDSVFGNAKSSDTEVQVWGIEVDDGWRDLLTKGCEEIALLRRHLGIKIVSTQIKEKYGTLRWYYYMDETLCQEAELDAARRLVENVINAAERMSERTCEMCGAMGKLRTDGWYTTLCTEHAFEQSRELDDYEQSCLTAKQHKQYVAYMTERALARMNLDRKNKAKGLK